MYRLAAGSGTTGDWDGTWNHVTDDTFASRGLCEPGRVRELVERHRSGVADHGDVLWGLVNLELWQRTFLDRFSDAPRIQPT